MGGPCVDRACSDWLTTLACALILAGCGSDAGQEPAPPAEPTWFADVQPLMLASCASCHGSVPYAPEIDDFRLDRYVLNDPDSFDAYDYRELIVAHAVDLLAPAMPLGGELSETEKETLRRWLEQGAPKGTRDNSLPGAELLQPLSATASADQLLALSFRSFDDDDDGLIVDLGYRDLDGGNEVILHSALATGATDLDVDTGQLLSLGHFEFFVRLDDGYSDEPAENRHEVVLIDDLLVDHGARGTAPTVTLLTPNGGDTLIGPTTITWQASDPDPGDTLTIAIDLLALDAASQVTDTISLANGLANAPASLTWDSSSVPSQDNAGTPIAYKIRVTATDAGAQNTRSDVSDATFTVAAAGGSTDLTWDDVKPIFLTYCSECHSQPAKTIALEYFRLDKYDAADPQAPSNSDIGVFEQRSLVYQRLVVAGSMPPAAKPRPSQSQVDQIDEWILAGAPFGGGGADAPPSFTWVTPNNSATTTVGSANVTLMWMASDPEGLPLTGSIMMAELPNGVPPLNPATATCSGLEPGYTEVVGSANIGDNSFDLTLPASGFFCFKADLTDAAAQTVSALATRPIRL